MDTANLENRMVRYRDLMNVKTRDNGEPLIPITGIPNGYVATLNDMERVAGKTVLVRKDILKRLIKAQTELQKAEPTMSLFITYGYRTLGIQTRRFLERLRKEAETYYPDPVDLYEKVHRSVAVPSVAGHPTGGAVDVRIVTRETGKQLDFGSAQYDYSNLRYYVFSGEVTDVQRSNRMLLRKIMMNNGFAPYDGEWWHFSYGDREWAYYYRRPYALYRQLDYPFSGSQKPAPSLSHGRRRSSGSLRLNWLLTK